MRILLIEDSQETTDKICKLLNTKEIIIDSCDFAQKAFDMCSLYEYNLIILEQMLETVSGDNLTAQLREKGVKTPILIISRSTDIDKKISALRKGADDYIVQPFNTQEFLARIKAVVRRSNGYAHNKMKIGELEIDLSEQKVYYDGEMISLTKKEYLILEFLFLKKGSTLNKDRFLNHLYSLSDEPEAKIIDVFICKLRKKLEKASGGKNFIQTDWGRGYYINEYEK
jgi:two-component system cell cycle response regulator CtrA